MWKFDSIDEKALQAKDNEESSIRALVDEVFGTPEGALILPEYREEMKKRVLEAELDYRNGLSEGITEENVVRTVNELVDKFNAPDFARTSALQVRVLRAGLTRDYPNFIAQETDEEDVSMEATIGDWVSPTMSPLEAVYVTAAMLHQKWLSENYQYAPQEWVDQVYSKAVERWRANRAVNSGHKPSDEHVEYRLEMPKNSEQCNQIARIAIKGAATLLSSHNSSASRNLYDATLDTLGIKRLNARS
ncbi:MAG TPA: hypothetical protein VF708_10450 [Pyrinomonadaceae bacterium]|jgi:hypothetical protein